MNIYQDKESGKDVEQKVRRKRQADGIAIAKAKENGIKWKDQKNY